MKGTGHWLRWVMGVLLASCFLSVVCAADFTTEQWRVVEIPLTSSVSYADPFQNVDVTATFTGPGGKVIVRPAFWDGGNIWRIRFAPTVTGQWSMVTTCTDPTNSGMQGATRTIQCNAYTGPYAIYQHGFLKVSANGRYFTYADGTPFFYLGDTHWLYIHERFDTSNVPGVASEFQYTVDKRVTQGFTVFQSEAIHISQGGTQTVPDEEPHADLTNGLTAADLPGFWNIDRKFAYIADHGLVHANGEITWALEPTGNAVYTQAYMTKLGRYWAARYGAYPVLWTVAQEIDPNMYNAYDTNSIGLWFAGAQAVSSNDGYGHPLGPHMQANGSGINSPADSWWASKPYHKFWAMQLQPSVTFGDLSGFTYVKSFWTNVPTKPIVLFESPYDHFWTGTTGAHSNGYKAFQWGMCGYGYGANGIWNDLYSYADSDWGTAYAMPSSYLNWYDGANLVAGGQLTYLKNFYTSLNWWNLTPHFDDSAWSSFADVNHSFLSSDGNTTYVVYFFGAGNSTGTLKGMAAGMSYEASWFNPRTGVYTDFGGIMPTAAGQWTAPLRPSSEDWILLVKQNPSTVFPSPANGATVSAALPQVSWTVNGSPSNLSYAVYFGSAANYDPNQPNGNLVRITPPGGTTNKFAAIPGPLPAGATYDWMLAVTNSATGTTNLYTWSFTTASAAVSIAVSNPSFETPMPGGVGGGWAQIGAPWVVSGTTLFQQNNLTPKAGAHFTSTSPGGGKWYALLNANTGSIVQDLQTTVNAGDTLSITFYGGRGQAGSSTADGGVFNATFLVGSTPYSMQVDTTALAQNAWQSFTLTKLVTNSGNLSLKFNAVSGDAWVDNISNVVLIPASAFSVTVTNPVDSEGFLTGSSITASAMVTNGTGPYTVAYHLNAVGGASVLAGTAFSAPYAVNLGALAPGTYEINATVTDSAPSPATTTSLTSTFTVASTTTIPVENGSFETPGILSSTTGWAHLATDWNPSHANDLQQNNLADINIEDVDFTSSSPGGGNWCALINANTGSIVQNLQTTVNAGDTLSITFYGGRGRDGTSTADGGVFNATFLVGSTPYSMQVDTTALAKNAWQSFTLTKFITNSGNLSLEFNAVNGDPWLDNISDVALTPATPYTAWIARFSGVPSDQTGFNADPNHDGVANGLVWLLGGQAPLGDSHGLLPVLTFNTDRTLTLVFDCLKPADWGTATLEVDYSHDLSTWVSATVPGSNGTVNGVSFTISGTDPLHVTAVIPIDTDNKLFVRLRATMP